MKWRLGLGLTRIRVTRRVNKDLEAEQVGGDARAQAGLGAEGGEEDLLVVDPAADPPVGGELAWCGAGSGLVGGGCWGGSLGIEVGVRVRRTLAWCVVRGAWCMVRDEGWLAESSPPTPKARPHARLM